MISGFYAALAAQELADTEARLQREKTERRAAAQQAIFGHLASQSRQHGDVIDVEAREVPDALPLPAPPTK